VRRAGLPGTVPALLIICACGSPGTSATPTPSVAEMKVLAASAVPGLTFVTTTLTAATLSKDAELPQLASDLRSWGYVDGRERTFQGESRQLTLVVSRSMIFKDAAGAHEFVAFVQANHVAYFGAATASRPLVAQGRSGWLFTPPLCACHLASPAFIGVLVAASGVVWLEINGPDATAALLVNLLDPALSVPSSVPG
jgi:hypothetical protein